MIKRIFIEQLYDKYDYDINISESQSVTILTGPNGYGKTTILKAINHLFACDFWFFYLLRFKKIVFYFRNGKQLKIVKNTKEPLGDTERENSFSKEEVSFSFLDDKEEDIETFEIGENDMLRWERRMSPSYRIREINNLDREARFISNSNQILDDKGRSVRMFMQEYYCPFIKEQRLFRPEIIKEYGLYKNEAVIEDIAKEIILSFSKVQQEFAVKSQEIDATFIERLVRDSQEPLPENVFRQKREALKEKMNNLRKYGLASHADILEEYPHEQRKALSLYINDMEQKLSCYDTLYKQLSVFDSTVSSKQLSDKRIRLNSQKGITVIDIREQEIPLAKLSSGEQSLIILYYKLSFELNNRSVLLIDEPENSLHIAWQRQMLDDYLKMAKELKCQVIIATHSSIFINGRWDIAFDLFENKYQD